MFEYAVVDGRGRALRPGVFAASMAGELGLIALAILFPLVFVEALPQAAWLVRSIPLAAPPPVRPLSPAPLAGPAAPASPRPAYRDARLFEPVRYPSHAAILVDPAPDPAAGAGPAGPGVANSTGDARTALDPILASAIHIPAAPPPPVRVETPPVELAPPPLYRVGGKVRPPTPLATPAPEYPPLARQARVEGIVNLEAVIGVDGTICSVKLVRGPALLVAAAMAAVRTWRYTPPSLNGEPIEVVMYVDVRFQLHQ
jgi:protein TonB